MSEHALSLSLGYDVPRAVLKALREEARRLGQPPRPLPDQSADGAGVAVGGGSTWGRRRQRQQRHQQPADWRRRRVDCRGGRRRPTGGRRSDPSARLPLSVQMVESRQMAGRMLGTALRRLPECSRLQPSTLKTSSALSAMPTNMILNVLEVLETTSVSACSGGGGSGGGSARRLLRGEACPLRRRQPLRAPLPPPPRALLPPRIAQPSTTHRALRCGLTALSTAHHASRTVGLHYDQPGGMRGAPAWIPTWRRARV